MIAATIIALSTFIVYTIGLYLMRLHMKAVERAKRQAAARKGAATRRAKKLLAIEAAEDAALVQLAQSVAIDTAVDAGKPVNTTQVLWPFYGDR